MTRWARGIIAILLSCALAACSNVSRFDVREDPDTHAPTVRTIVQRIKCELAVIASDQFKFHSFIDQDDFVVALQLSLTVNDDGSLAPAFTYTNGVFSFNAGARLELSREQNFTERLFFSLAGIKKQMENGANLGCPELDTFLAGDLGLVPSTVMALTGGGLNLDTKLDKTDGAFGGYVTFVLTKNLNAVGPTYTLTHFKGPGSLAGVSEVNTDKITFAFARRSAKGKIPEAVAASRAAQLLDSVQLGQVSTTIQALRGQ